MTRARIHQICESLDGVLRQGQSVNSALDRVLRVAARHAPTGVEDINEQLRHCFGDEAGIESLVSWGRLLGREPALVRCERTRATVRGHDIDVTMVKAAISSPWVHEMLRHVSRDSSVFGCTNIVRIAGLTCSPRLVR
jgi:hypothetical protein